VSRRTCALLAAACLLAAAGAAAVFYFASRRLKPGRGEGNVLDYLRTTVGREDVLVLASGRGSSRKQLRAREAKELVKVLAAREADLKVADAGKAGAKPVDTGWWPAPNICVDVQTRTTKGLLVQLLGYSPGDHVRISVYGGPCDGVYYFDKPFPELLKWVDEVTAK